MEALLSVAKDPVASRTVLKAGPAIIQPGPGTLLLFGMILTNKVGTLDTARAQQMNEEMDSQVRAKGHESRLGQTEASLAERFCQTPIIP